MTPLATVTVLAPCLLIDAVAVLHSVQIGIFKINNRQLAAQNEVFRAEAAYYLLYTDLGILRALSL